MKDRIKWGVLLAVCLLLVIGNVRTYAQQDMGRIISVPVVNAWTLKEISDSLKVEILISATLLSSHDTTVFLRFS